MKPMPELSEAANWSKNPDHLLLVGLVLNFRLIDFVPLLWFRLREEP